MMPMMICAVLVIIIIGQLVSIFQETSPQNNSLPKKIKLIAAPQKLSTNLFFFGDYVPTNDAEIKHSMLNVQVVGIMFANNENDSRVIIRSARGSEEMFRVGDAIPGGAIIKRIMASGIVVLRNGELERLSLPKNELFFESSIKRLRKG